MLQGFSVFSASHNLSLALLAGAIAVLGSFVTLILFAQARLSHGQVRRGWILLAAFASAALLWTTHFVGMLSFEPSVVLGYAPNPTALSFFIAALISGAGFAIAVGNSMARSVIGGAVIGFGLVAMHAFAMRGFHVQGIITRDPAIFAVAAAAILVSTAAAMTLAARSHEPREFVVAPLVFGAGIAAFHVLAHMALAVEPMRGMDMPDTTIPPGYLGYFVTAMGLLLFGTGLATIMIVRGFSNEASMQLRNITDAAVEGLVLTDGERIIDVNASFRQMMGGADAPDVAGQSIWSLIDYRGDRDATAFEAQLRTAQGPIPIEVITRDAHAGGAVTRIFAVRDLRERHAAEHRIRYLAHYDTLTGLPNRAAFQERFEAELFAVRARGDDLAILILDLDHFKEINDVHGHATGDEILKAVCDRVSDCIGQSEFAARLGGDEFVILQFGASQPATAGKLAEELIETMSRAFDASGRRFHVGMTIGVAVAPRDGTNTRTLLSNADLALYRAKEEGRSRVCFFTPEMDELVRERRILAQELKEAIENDELQVYYQAQAAVNGGEILGFEALARWKHPRRGFVPPSEFVKLAEESDLILALGEWMLRTVCREAASWTRPYRVAVNVSAVQFKKADLPELIHEVLLETGMPGSRLELEITETALVEDLQRTLDILRRIKALGVSIAMDDFGTGYSSLSTLQAFPFDKIKIDKSFVEAIGARQQSSVIVSAVLGLGRSLKIPVLAEGVETQNQLSFLGQENCAQAQGFLIGHPVGLDGIRHIVFGSPDEPVTDKDVEEAVAAGEEAAAESGGRSVA